MNFSKILEIAREKNASDIHLIKGELPAFRIEGKLVFYKDIKIDEDFLNLALKELLGKREFLKGRDLDFDYEDEKKLRYRVNLHWERGNVGISLRVINDEIKTIDELGLPQIAKEMIRHKKGLILVTGPSGSGKSTTLATLLEELNKTQNLNIITLEDPIEYLFTSKKSLVRQRRIGEDVESFEKGLESALRQDPDVIMIGELRDKKSLSTALVAGETGHLVLGTMHTNSASATITRIKSMFKGDEQEEIGVKLATILVGIISQKLVVGVDGKRVGAYEILVSNKAISSLILSNKTNQIESYMELGKKEGMVTMKEAISKLYQEKKINRKEYEENLD